MKLYNLKQAAEYLGISYKKLHYAVSQEYWGFNKGEKSFSKNKLDSFMRSSLLYKINSATDPKKKAQYMAKKIEFEMRSYAEEFPSYKDASSAWFYLGRKFLTNANQVAEFIEAYK